MPIWGWVAFGNVIYNSPPQKKHTHDPQKTGQPLLRGPRGRGLPLPSPPLRGKRISINNTPSKLKCKVHLCIQPPIQDFSFPLSFVGSNSYPPSTPLATHPCTHNAQAVRDGGGREKRALKRLFFNWLPQQTSPHLPPQPNPPFPDLEGNQESLSRRSPPLSLSLLPLPPSAATMCNIIFPKSP